jgi:hypothetical protein
MSLQYSPGFPFRPLFCFLVLLTGTVSAPAATRGVPQPPCSPASTEEFLNARLAFWQQDLNLADWKLSVLASHPSDLKPNTLGNIHWDVDNKSAVVRVLSPSDYQLSCPAALDDIELTVVHELVHLTLSRLRGPGTNLGDEEHAVVQIADALLHSNREARHLQTQENRLLARAAR